MPGKIIPVRHSLTDWDFQYPNGYRSLDPVLYVSPPSSLKFGPALGPYHCSVLCRIPETQCLPQGEFRMWMHTDEIFLIPAMFRNQKPLGAASWNNSYYLVQYSVDYASMVYFYRRVADSDALVDQTTGYHAFNEWVHYRVFWYNGKTPAEEDALCVDYYREVAGEWVKLGNTMYDTANRWKDSAVNRVGHQATLYSGQYVNFDDTEIWGPV